MTPLQIGRRPLRQMLFAVVFAGLGTVLGGGFARADDTADADAKAADSGSDPLWAIHGQATVVDQGTLAFPSAYRGPQSLDPGTRARETVDATLFIGFRVWKGAELWVNPEIDQGFGLNGTFGVAGFPSAEAYKVGKSDPYLKLPRVFLRQTIDLGGESQAVEADANQFAGRQTANRLVIWIGKFSVGDVFDTNKYAHDPRGDFLNWTVVDTGAFDYAADAWAYTAGTAVEWYQGNWTARLGAFNLSTEPNSQHLDWSFGQFQLDGEVEERHTIAGHPGKIAVTTFLSRGRMGKYDDAIALGEQTGEAPSTALVRHYRGRDGVSVNLEQELTPTLGLFARGGAAEGDAEPYEFTDVDRTGAVGLSLAGKAWGRADDTVGLAGVVNEISKAHIEYLADGGLGILVGDGKLIHSGPEQIVETYYDAAVTHWFAVTLDGQVIVNPAYNKDRGPVPVLAARLHAHF